MSDRTENRRTNRQETEAPGARKQPAEEYADYREREPDETEPREAEAVREAALQPGTPESEEEDDRAEDRTDG